jgi:retron-type reverse transcriptase
MNCLVENTPLLTYFNYFNYPKSQIMKKTSLTSKITFNKSIAIKFFKMDYYKSYISDQKNLLFREKLKYKTSAPRQDLITRKIKEYKNLLKIKSQGHFNILKGIYNENKQKAEESQDPPIHTNLHSLIHSIPILITSYKKIRKNKGSTTLGAMLAFHKLQRLNPLQRKILSSTVNSPDGLSYSKFKTISNLLKQGKYPWGASRRIYIDKPGQPEKKRPLTIPPFMDRIIQTNILQILQSIYEPWFELQNVSFGFREKKGVHDAIYSLTKRENKGLYMAIEGDIQGAYDNVDREKLITILSKRIKDRKFLNLIQNRLNYTYLDSTTNKYVTEKKGIPQGGIDSPYLWNIYLSEFDEFVKNYMDNLLTNLNKKIRGNYSSESNILTKLVSQLKNKRKTLLSYLNLLNKNIPIKQQQKLALYKSIEKKALATNKPLKYVIIKEIKNICHQLRNNPASDPNKKVLRYSYARYADDWILLGNFPKLLAIKIKKDFAEWLDTNLSAKLSTEKTLITDFRKEPAHFLGFEIKTYETRKLSYKSIKGKAAPVLTRVAGSEIKAFPDQQRLLSRLHMKGYCTKKGIPKPISWLSTFEIPILISRWNAVLRGFGNFYLNWVNKSSLNRWIYIIRFSLFKTIAQKYNTNIKGVFKKFGIRTNSGNTIISKIRNNITNPVNNTIDSYVKKWQLYTEKDIQNFCIDPTRKNYIMKNYNRIYYDKKLPIYDEGNPFPSIKEDDYLNKIMWVNLRTMANFDFPCSLCGAPPPTVMHHIKHIRKTNLINIPDDKPHLKIMYLRNRRQIPVCTNCHLNIIHRGKYNGANLKSLLVYQKNSDRPSDNRLITIENYIKHSNKEFYGKTLEEKGWEKEKEQ